jgi:prohibitin 2
VSFMKYILSIAGWLCIVGAVAIPVLAKAARERGILKQKDGEPEDTAPKLHGWQRATTLVAGGLALLLVSSALVQVNAGQVGVVKVFGAVTGRLLAPGLHAQIPVVQTVEMYRTQRLIYETSDNPDASSADYRDYSVDTMTEDGQRIKVRYTVAFNIDGTKADWVAQNIGTEEDVVEKVVKANSRSEGRNIPKSFKASDLYGQNVYKCQQAIFDKLQPVFARSGVTLVEFLLRDIGFDENLAQALEQKQIALERQVTALREVEVKAAEASQAIAAAKGVAQSEIEKARGQAEAIRLINEQLARAPWYNEYLVSKGIAEGTTNIQWALVPSGSTPLVDFRQSTAATKKP